MDLILPLLGVASGLAVVALWVVIAMLSIGWPLMFFSAVRALKGIRREMAALNERAAINAYVNAPPGATPRIGPVKLT